MKNFFLGILLGLLIGGLSTFGYLFWQNTAEVQKDMSVPARVQSGVIALFNAFTQTSETA